MTSTMKGVRERSEEVRVDPAVVAVALPWNWHFDRRETSFVDRWARCVRIQSAPLRLQQAAQVPANRPFVVVIAERVHAHEAWQVGVGVAGARHQEIRANQRDHAPMTVETDGEQDELPGEEVVHPAPLG